MKILDIISKAQETMKQYDAEPKCVVMHPSSAEKLLEHFIGIKCNIEWSCPQDQVYVMQVDPRKEANNGQN